MKPRRAERIRAFLGAQILFNHGNSTVDCHVRNISAGGAKLAVSPTVSVPQEFDLVIPQKGRTYRCRLRWRLDEAAGVEFVDGTAADETAGETAAIKERLRALEKENEELLRNVRELTDLLAAAEALLPSNLARDAGDLQRAAQPARVQSGADSTIA